MKALDIECPKCKAAAGFPCMIVLNRNKIIEQSTFHAQRVQRAHHTIPRSTAAMSPSAIRQARDLPGRLVDPAAHVDGDIGAVGPGPRVSAATLPEPPASERDTENRTAPTGSAGPTAPPPSVMLICGHPASARESIRTLGTECYCEQCDPPHWVKRQDRGG